MKKMNNKGFMLTETLIVSTLLISVLLVVYTQFKSVNRNIENDFSYDSISSLYTLYNMKLYIEQQDYSTMTARLELNDYLDITDCSEDLFTSSTYCKSIIEKSDIEKIYIVKENLYSIIENEHFDKEMTNYIETIKYDNVSDGYRLIASFNNGTYANVKVLNDDKFNDVIANACVPTLLKKYTINYFKLDGSVLKEPYIGTYGCSLSLPSDEYEELGDSCYYIDSYTKDSINISLDETNNSVDIYYAKYVSNLTISFKDMNDNKIADDVVLQGDCGTVYYPENYKKDIEGYVYTKITASEIALASTNTNVTLYYTEGSASNE